MNGGAEGGCGPRSCGPADSSEAEGVEPPREHASQDTAAGGPAVVRVDDGQRVPGGPLQVEVIVVRADGAAPRDLKRGVGDTPEKEGGGRSGS